MIYEAHRGVATDYTENTMPAFRAAADLHYGMIELDTKFTSDNVCVILHDRTVNRIGRNKDGSRIENEIAVADITFEQLCEYDFGEERIPTLEDVLALAKERNIRLKFDHVFQTHTKEQLGIFFDTIRKSGASALVGFTSNSIDFIQNEILAAFPDASVHYDGAVNEDVLKELSAIIPKERLTVWCRMENPLTSWNKTPPIDVCLSDMIRKYASLGIWILSEESERDEAEFTFHADIIETNGAIKPRI